MGSPIKPDEILVTRGYPLTAENQNKALPEGVAMHKSAAIQQNNSDLSPKIARIYLQIGVLAL